MKKELAEQKLVELIGFDFDKEPYETSSILDWFGVEDFKNLRDWCDGHDEVIFMTDEHIDTKNLKMLFYAAQSESPQRDIMAWIVIDDKDNVFSYGYSGD